MKTDPQIKAYIENLPTDQRRIVQTLRQIVKEALPKVQEEFKWGMPWYSPVCYIMRSKNHVSLGFAYGALVQDKKLRVEGTGKVMRHIKIKGFDEIEPPHLVRLLRAAEKVSKKKAK